MIISVSIHTCKTENLSLIINMCDDHHQLLRGREGEGEGEREGSKKILEKTSFQDCFFLWRHSSSWNNNSVL